MKKPFKGLCPINCSPH